MSPSPFFPFPEGCYLIPSVNDRFLCCLRITIPVSDTRTVSSLVRVVVCRLATCQHAIVDDHVLRQRNLDDDGVNDEGLPIRHVDRDGAISTLPGALPTETKFMAVRPQWV